MNILTLATVFPYPPQDGTKIQIYHRIKHLSERNQVTLLCIVDRQPEPELVLEMERYCDCVLIIRPATRFSKGLLSRCVNFLRSVVAGTPYYELDQFRRDAAEWIQREVGAKRFDVIEADGSAGIYLRMRLDARKVWVMHSVADANEKRKVCFVDGRLRRMTIGAYRPIGRRFDRKVGRNVDLVAVLTRENEAEVKQIDRRIPVSCCLTNGVDLGAFPFEASAARAGGVCFVGKMDHYPNHDAALHFYRDIWPSVHAAAPDTMFYVVGAKPMDEVVALRKDPSVEITGYVDDVRPFLRSAGVAVAPLRMGGGILNKVLEAMAMGVPVVASGLAVHGLSVESGQHLFVCDDDQEFAEAVSRLLNDADLRRLMAASARRYVRQHHQWGPIVCRYENSLRALVATHRKGNRNSGSH